MKKSARRIKYLTLFLFLLPVYLGAQQLRVANVDETKFPSVKVTLEVNGVADTPARDDFVVKEGDRPYPLEMLIQDKPQQAGANRQLLILLDVGPDARGEDLLKMKKGVQLAMENSSSSTAIGVAYFNSGQDADKNFFLVQEPTRKTELYMKGMLRIYSTEDTTSKYHTLGALKHAVKWMGEHKQDMLSEIVIVTVGGGKASSEDMIKDLVNDAEGLQIPVHTVLYHANQASVVDQLREVSAKSKGQFKKTTNVTALHAVLTNILGEATAEVKLGDYTVLVTFQSDQREDGEPHTAKLYFRGKSIPVSYRAASEAYDKRAEKSLLDEYGLYLIMAGAVLLLIVIASALGKRQKRLRKQLQEEKNRHQAAEAKMKAQYEQQRVVQPSKAVAVIPEKLSTVIAGQSYEFMLTTPVITMGRAPENDITLPSPTVSAKHAILKLQDEGWWVEDLNSTNGTYINAGRVERMAVRVGDKLSLGDVTLTVT